METVYLKLYDPTDNYIAPSGEYMDAAKVYEHFPAATSFTYVVHTDAGGEMMIGFYSLSSLRAKYNIDGFLSDIEAVQAIEDAMNAEREQQDAEMKEVAERVTPEERIAAALEFQTLTSLPNIE